jgi:hypothetical protein
MGRLGMHPARGIAGLLPDRWRAIRGKDGAACEGPSILSPWVPPWRSGTVDLHRAEFGPGAGTVHRASRCGAQTARKASFDGGLGGKIFFSCIILKVVIYLAKKHNTI